VLVAAFGLTVGVFNATAMLLAIIVITVANLLLIIAYGGRVYDVLDRIGARSHDMRQYHPLFETIAALPSDVSFFAKLQAEMGRTAGDRLEALSRLMRLVRFAQLRRDGLFGVLYYLSQLFLLTDFHVLAWMELWQREHGSAVRRWLEDVGRAEAISSLATLAHDNPHWCMPTVDQQQGTTLVAKQIGHPLLGDDVCARNDIEVGPAGTFVLVTGSNMSGKSTLLRAVGLNVILAQAGGPVPAKEFRTPPVQLATSMRMRDSLAGGVSFFMAELRRLKEIVDESRDCQRRSQLCLYLLDEILQGTNSTERHIAVSRIIGHLVEQGSIGMVSTHDLELAGADALKNASRPVHFRESITGQGGNEQMTFDYVLRPGVSPTTNALKLLKFVGLDD
jgi:DNA mismatch repair ATPase MutS